MVCIQTLESLQKSKQCQLPTIQKLCKAFSDSWVTSMFHTTAQHPYPLRKLLHKDYKRLWTITCQTTFDSLKYPITPRFRVGYFGTNKEATIYTDTSLRGIPTAIAQNTPNKEDHKLISYTSLLFTPTKELYSQIERE